MVPSAVSVGRFARLATIAALASCNGPTGAPPPASGSIASPLPRPSAAAIAAPPETLATLVPAGAAARADRGIDAAGRFVCRQAYSVLPSAEDAGCAMADGHEIQATIELAAPARGPVEMYAVEPLHLWKRSRCGAGRQPVTHPPAALLAKLAPGLRERPSALAGIQVGACTDARLSIQREGARHRFIHDTVHRFEPTGDEATISLRVAGKTLRWQLTREAAPAVCPDDPRPRLPWSLDLELLCRGDIAVMTATQWRPRVSPSCVARGGVLAPPDPPAPPCTSIPGSAPEAWIARPIERVRFHLDTADIEPIALHPPELHASAP